MKINKVIIDNFRNIIHAEYDLTQKNIFAGPNRRGKTNTILAIYWALSDTILNGSNDYTTFKPLHNPALNPTVELLFDSGFTIKKMYKQEYTKGEVSGNTTEYWINDEPTKQTEARKKIKKFLGTNRDLDADKVDLIQVLCDPYYLSEKLDYKLLRKFVIELIGDVNDEDVIQTDPSFNDAVDVLKKHGYDTVAAAKDLKDKIGTAKKEIDEYRNQIIGLERVQDIDSEVLARSKRELEETDQRLAELNQSKLTKVNPNIARLQKEISDLQLKLSKSMDADRAYLDKQNQSLTNRMIPLNDNLRLQNTLLEQETKKFFDTRSSVSNLMNDIDTLKRKLESTQSLVVSKRKEWSEVSERQYHPMPHMDAKNCPHCGGVLNQELLDHHTAREVENAKRFGDTQKADLEVIVSAGKKANEELVNIQMSIDVKQKELITKTDELNELTKLTHERQSEIRNLQEQTTAISYEKAMSYESDTTKSLQEKLSILQKQLSDETLANYASNVDDRINQVYAQQDELKKAVDKHRAFVIAQQEIKKVKKDIDVKLDVQTRLESKLAIVNNFMKAKLNLIKTNAEKVFGSRVSLTLIEPNIEGDGWKQVCYFSVLDKDTQFKNGSGSEKILNGIYLIECVRRHLGLEVLPVIFDECDKLDSAAIAGLDTNAQIITTKVDDQNYKDVTLLSI